MPTALKQINAESRKEMICPNCHERGLKEAPKYAAQCGDSKKQQIIYATACTNPECEYYASRDNSSRVPAEKIKRQYSPSSSRTLSFNWSIARVAIGVIAVIGIVGLLFSTGGFLSDSPGSAEASPTIEESNDGVTEVDTLKPWTIYKADGEYYAAAVRDGETVYLNEDGEVVSHLVTFGKRGAVEDAIRQWQTRQNQGLTNGTVQQTSEDLIGGSEWTVYERNGTAFIAAERNGEIVYINSSLGVQDSPYFYDNASEARDTLIEFESTPSGLVDSSDWEFIEYGGDIIVGATPDSGPREGETVFLQPDGTVSTDPYHYDSETEANDALDNFDGWDSVERSTVDFDGSDDDSSSDTVDYNSTSSGSVQNDLSNSNIDATEQTGGGSQSSTVQGSVSDSNGEPVEGATVHLYSNHYTTTTDSNGTFEFTDIPTGEHEIHIQPPAGSDLTATENTTFKLEAEGITSVEDTQTSSYFMQDGLVSQNEIHFNPKSEQPIKATGEGTNASASLIFANNRNADDIEVTLSNRYAAGISTKDVYSGTGKKIATVNGGADPKIQSVAVDSKTTSSPRSVTVTDGDTFVRDGNLIGENATVKVSGQETTNQRSVTGTGGGTVMNRGNTETTAEVTVTGRTTTNQQSVSKTGTGQISNGGNLDTTATITLNGRTENLGTETSSGTANDSSFTVQVDGEAPAQNVQLELYGKGHQTGSKRSETAKDWGNDESDELEVPGSGRYKIEYDASGYAAAYDDGGDPYSYAYYDYSITWQDYDYSSFSDNYHTEETFAEDEASCGDGVCDNGGTEISSGSKGSVIRDLGGRDEISLSAWAESYDQDGDDAFYPPTEANAAVTIYQVTGPKDTTVLVDGREVSAKNIRAGETKTVNLGELEPGEHTITVQTQTAAAVDYTASWDERSAPTDITVDADGDGDYELTRSDPLYGGDSLTTNVELEPGTTTVSVGSNGPTPTWDATYTELTATKNLQTSVSGTGDTTEVASLLREDETATVQVAIPAGGEVDISHSGAAPNWQSEFTERSVTKTPRVKVGEGELHEDGYLKPDEEITAPGSRLTSESYQVSSTTASGPQPIITIDYTARAIAEEAKITINGEEYQYPGDYNRTGKLTRETDAINITALTTGNNEITVTSSPANGVETNVTATLRYPSESLQTSRPTVHVVRPDGTVTSKPVPKTALSDGNLLDPYTISLDKSAFGSGENIIIVETPDGSQVGVEVTGTSSTPQSDIFEPTSTVPYNATLP